MGRPGRFTRTIRVGALRAVLIIPPAHHMPNLLAWNPALRATAVETARSKGAASLSAMIGGRAGSRLHCVSV